MHKYWEDAHYLKTCNMDEDEAKMHINNGDKVTKITT